MFLTDNHVATVVSSKSRHYMLLLAMFRAVVSSQYFQLLSLKAEYKTEVINKC